MMIRPRPLLSGDTIGIVAPGRKVTPGDVEEAVSTFQAWGLNVVAAPRLFSNDHPYLAGTDQQRLHDLQRMIDDPAIAAVICARGGYGSSRFIDALNYTSLQDQPKWIIGFSDVTAIHLKLYSLGIESVHGTMPILFPMKEAKPSVESLRKILFDEQQIIEASGHSFNRVGECTGFVVGGNLSLLVDSLGTSSELNTEGKILVIEEIDEYRYKIDRMINQLKRAGKLNALKGLIVGYMTDIKDPSLPFGEDVNAIVLQHTKEFSYPIAFNFPIGHENPNMAWRHGATGTLNVAAEKSSLTF